MKEAIELHASCPTEPAEARSCSVLYVHVSVTSFGSAERRREKIRNRIKVQGQAEAATVTASTAISSLNSRTSILKSSFDGLIIVKPVRALLMETKTGSDSKEEHRREGGGATASCE